MSKNSTNSHQPAVANTRVEATVVCGINAKPEDLFLLACPVKELLWIPGWEYRLLYSKSGVNETNCIFTENMSGTHFFGTQLTTTWVTVLHDPAKCRILFQLYLDGKATVRFTVGFQKSTEELSTCSWHMVFTALDEDANAMTAETIRAKLELMMTFLSQALKHYCEKGRMLK